MIWIRTKTAIINVNEIYIDFNNNVCGDNGEVLLECYDQDEAIVVLDYIQTKIAAGNKIITLRDEEACCNG